MHRLSVLIPDFAATGLIAVQGWSGEGVVVQSISLESLAVLVLSAAGRAVGWPYLVSVVGVVVVPWSLAGHLLLVCAAQCLVSDRVCGGLP